MANEPSVLWPGKSGAKYSYTVYPLHTSFVQKPGNYIFAKLVSGKWLPVYVGETADLSSRFTNHHRQQCIDSNAATHIHVHVNSRSDKARIDEETDIRRNFNPSCNLQ